MSETATTPQPESAATAPDLSKLIPLDLSKLTDEDRTALFNDFVDAGKRLAKCTETTWDDLVFQLLSAGNGPRIIGQNSDEVVAAVRAAATNGGISNLDPATLLTLIQLVGGLINLFRKR